MIRWAGLLLTLLSGATLAGCGRGAEQAGVDESAASAATIGRHLSTAYDDTPGSAAKLAAVRVWFAQPDRDWLAANGEPQWRLLPSSADRVEVAVYAYGRDTAFGGKQEAWGHVCQRYTVDTDELTVTTVECPGGLPDTPT